MKLINPLEDESAYVYHYTSRETALNKILLDNTLLLNTISKVNDPRESKHWQISPLIRSNLNLELEQYEAISEEVSKIIKENAKIVCFSKDKASAVKAWQPEALLNRGFAKPSMWHHYAKGHDGVCLMFNREKLITVFQEQLTDRHLFHGPVTYSDKGILQSFQNDPFVIDLLNLNDRTSYFEAIKVHFDRWHKQLFFHKLSDWANEDEYRLMYIDNHSQPCPLKFGDALDAIVIGEGVDKIHYEEFLKHCARHKAEITNLSWYNGYPKIVHPRQPYKEILGT